MCADVALPTVSWEQFSAIDIRVGTIIEASKFPQARKPSLVLVCDFGDAGMKRTSSQLVSLYEPEVLLGRQILGVINVGVKQIGPIRSEFLLLGVYTPEGVVMATVERSVQNGLRLC